MTCQVLINYFGGYGVSRSSDPEPERLLDSKVFLLEVVEGTLNKAFNPFAGSFLSARVQGFRIQGLGFISDVGSIGFMDS